MYCAGDDFGNKYTMRRASGDALTEPSSPRACSGHRRLDLA
jgi:hypothetical protein